MKELLTPTEWCQRLGVRVIDPHGWRGIGGVSWNNPISKGEFVGRAAISTTSVVLPSSVTDVVYPWMPFFMLLPGNHVHHGSKLYYVGGTNVISTGAEFEILPDMVDVGSWPPAPVSVHSVTWTIEGEDVFAELHCSAAVGSVCRLVCMSEHDCTTWDFGGEHDMQDCGHCNAIDYVGNCGCTSEFYDGPLHSVVDGPVVIEWDATSEMYVWRYVD